MKLSGLVQKTLKDFLLIFASIIIVLTILRQIYDPDLAFDLQSIYIVMAFSFLSALLEFILYSPHELSEEKMQIRMALHFFSLEIVLIALGSVFGIITSVPEGITLALQIAVIYTIVRLLSWRNDKKEAQQINDRLKALKNKVSG